MKEFKPCPFCGGAGTLYVWQASAKIRCNKCGAEIYIVGESAQDAEENCIKKWNNRVELEPSIPVSKIRERIEKLNKEVKRRYDLELIIIIDELESIIGEKEG